jgi:hypothetical protein
LIFLLSLAAAAVEEEIQRFLTLAVVVVQVVIEQVTPLAVEFLLQKHLVEEMPLNRFFLCLQTPVTQ